ncbi:MAG: Tetracycline resistance protein, class C [Syntrophorhabdus sp. PtaU1.Bin050]|nr:MAG: Tetracycline resistance protein, class C [Syntrophorhabdus sp. PtaU1.Bin050]
MKDSQSNSEKQSSLKFLLRALRYRNYRLFFSGQGISLVGTWMQQIAISWLVYRLTNSPFLLGFIGFVGQVPTFLLAPVAGVFADRWNRRKLLVLTQILAMLQAFLLAFLTFTGHIVIWHLVILSIILGLVSALDIPVRQSFVIDLVEDKNDLGNAIALNSVMFNGARLVGPSIAGLLISIVGEGMCFFLNGISFLAIVIALMAMNVPERMRKSETLPFVQGLRDGYRYTFGFAPIRYIILLLGLISLMGMPYLVLMPVFARDILHGGPHTLGFLMGASGIGALIGAVLLASKKTVLGLGRLIVIASSAFGTGLIVFSASRYVPLSLCMMLLTGFGMIVHMASSNTVLQTIVDEDKRGRIMSFYAMAFMGMAPFGSLLAGGLASKIGAPYTLTISGLACVAGSLLFLTKLPLMRRLVRPIYVQVGAIRELPTDLQ